MILTLIFSFIIAVLSIFLGILPDVETLNIFGIDVDTYLVQGRGYLEYLIGVIPPLGIVLAGFIAIMTFELILFVAKFFGLIK